MLVFKTIYFIVCSSFDGCNCVCLIFFDSSIDLIHHVEDVFEKCILSVFKVLAEFIRVTNVDIAHLFYMELDSMLPKLSAMLLQRGGKYANFIKSKQDEYPDLTA